MRYADFVDLTYKPKETDLLCTFYVEPEGITLKEAAGGVAADVVAGAIGDHHCLGQPVAGNVGGLSGLHAGA